MLTMRCNGIFTSLRANGSRECAPDDRLREAIQKPHVKELDCFVAIAPRNDGNFSYSKSDISAALPPAAAVLMVTVCSVAKRGK
jgi:hypothetical protein